jgi:hypothetical protein
MRLIYQGIELRLLRTTELDWRAVLDQSGLDYEYQLVTFGCTFIWNSKATASGRNLIGLDSIADAPLAGLAAGNQRLPVPGQGPPANADRFGVSLKNLREKLSQNQGSLKIYAAQDLVFDVPGQDQTRQAHASYPCDPSGGPRVLDCRIIEVFGDKSAVGVFRVQFAVTTLPKILLSHRWTATQTIDNFGFTARHIEGVGVLNLALLSVTPLGSVVDRNNQDVTSVIPDQFRQVFAHPRPAGFDRKSVRVYISEDAQEVRYSIEDVERNLNVGVDSPIARFECTATSNMDFSAKTAKQSIGSWIGLGKTAAGYLNPWNWITGSGPSLGDVASKAWGSLIPDMSVQVMARVYGRATARNAMQLLTEISIQAALDRCYPALGNDPAGFPLSKITGVHTTLSFSSDGAPMAETRIEVAPLTSQTLQSILKPTAAAYFLNFSSVIQGADARGLSRGLLGRYQIRPESAWGNPPLAFGDTGGLARWVAPLVVQALTLGNNPPPAVSVAYGAVDASNPPFDVTAPV